MFFMQVVFGLVFGLVSIGSLSFAVIEGHVHDKDSRTRFDADK
jgi:hypothetical protein